MEENRKYFFPISKKSRIKKFCKIISTSSYFPENIVTNKQIIEENHLPVTDIAIKKALGISQRRVADKNLSDSDILTKAAEICLKNVGIEPERLTRLIVTKFLGDHLMPPTSCMIQKKLKSKTAFHCYDIEGGINSFLTAFDMASKYISTGDEYVLLLSGGIINCLVNKKDPRVAFLFGDGAASILLGLAEEPHFLASYFYTNYEYYDHARSGGQASHLPDDMYTNKNYEALYDLYEMQNWKESIDFYLQATDVIKDALLSQSNLSMKDIDFVLVTENNKQIRDLTLEKLGVSSEKSFSVIENYGNTMSAMLPILFDHTLHEGKIKAGMNLMLISHGEGASGGGVIYRV